MDLFSIRELVDTLVVSAESLTHADTINCSKRDDDGVFCECVLLNVRNAAAMVAKRIEEIPATN